MSFDLSNLNEEQLKPVMDTEGPVLVTAGAGSGKTRLLTHRIAHLIDLNVKPYQILAITFTNKAANEMRDRLAKMIPDARELWVFTFHAMCGRILRRYISLLGYGSNFTIYGETEKEHTVKRLLKEKPNLPDDIAKRIMWHISNAKNDGTTPDDYYAPNESVEDIDLITDVYSEYEGELKKNNALDYDDMLLKAYQLLRDFPDVRDYYNEKFHYIHVDEFQDTNVIQYRIVKLLGARRRNIFVVGDEDQCIYGWRGANFSNIYDFTRDFPCKVYKLEQNYRSTKKILELANTLIKNNTTRLDKVLWTENPDGEKPCFFTAPGETNEADYVFGRIRELVAEGYNYADMAILMRINALSRSFEERFLQYGVPHKIFGGFKFYERKEIKDLLAYLSLVVNPADEEALLRVINFPKRGIGDGAVNQLRNYAKLYNRTTMDVILDIDRNEELPAALVKKVTPFMYVVKCLAEQQGKVPLDELVKYLVRMLNLREVYAEDTEENFNRKQNIGSFVEAVRQFGEANPDATLSDYLQSVTLYSDTDEMDSSDCVTIATVHSAKGLEFKVVFIVGLEDGIFPLNRSIDSPSELEEERRLMYVAITRAMEKLYMTQSATRFLYGSRKPTVPSRFLSEIGYSIRTSQPSADTPYRNSRTEADAGHAAKTIKSTYIYTPPVTQAAVKDVSGFCEGGRVRHKSFGEGVILHISGDVGGSSYAEIEFKDKGKITLALAFAPLERIED